MMRIAERHWRSRALICRDHVVWLKHSPCNMTTVWAALRLPYSRHISRMPSAAMTMCSRNDPATLGAAVAVVMSGRWP
jgi:hypothetical protein